MDVEVKVTCKATCDSAQTLRALACSLARQKPVEGYNAMVETDFNKILDAIVQEAFETGRMYERQQKN